MNNRPQMYAVPEPDPRDTEERVPGVDVSRLERLAARATIAAPRPALTVRAPFTGLVLGEVPRATAEDVELAVARAAAAQKLWRETSFAGRRRVLLAFHDLVLERQREVLDLIQLESGKARKNAFEEVADVAIVARYYAHHAEDHLRTRRRKGALPGLTATWEHHHPRGVVGFIAPWNYPLSLAVTDALPALMAGNGAVLKPDSQTPFTALWAHQLLEEAGLPRDLFHVVTGAGREIGAPLLGAVDFVTFTGSTETGRVIARQAGEKLIDCALELGGKNAMIVLADADLDKAVEGAVRGCFGNAGQLCISCERLLVHGSLYDRFLERFAERARGLVLGTGLDYRADVGSLVSARQLATVSEHVDDALAKGATAVAGGRPRREVGPYFYEPTILTGVTPEMKLYAEETFGPVVAVYPFISPLEAVERANDTRYGLNASIWSRDVAAARQLATRLEAGTVNLNEAYAAAWASVDAPMGGYKDSGIGRRHGREGILKYTESQTVAAQRLLPVGAPPGMAEETFARFLTTTLKVLRHIPGLR